MANSAVNKVGIIHVTTLETTKNAAKLTYINHRQCSKMNTLTPNSWEMERKNPSYSPKSCIARFDTTGSIMWRSVNGKFTIQINKQAFEAL